MRSFVAVAWVAVCAVLAAADGPAISTDNLRSHLQFLSSDEMRGRANGSAELERAADYIAQQFEQAGLEPGGVNGWFQPFEVIAGLIVGDGNQLSLTASGRTVTLGAGHQLLPAGGAGRLGSLDAVSTNWTWCSRATASRRPTRSYDDYAGLDVQGKAVLIFSHEPQERRREQPLERRAAADADDARSQGRRGARPRRAAADRRRRPDAHDRPGRLQPLRAGSRRRGPPTSRCSGSAARRRSRWSTRSRSTRAPAESTSDLVPRSRAADGRHDQLHGAPDEEPPHRPQRRGRAAGQRHGPPRSRPW